MKQIKLTPKQQREADVLAREIRGLRLAFITWSRAHLEAEDRMRDFCAGIGHPQAKVTCTETATVEVDE